MYKLMPKLVYAIFVFIGVSLACLSLAQAETLGKVALTGVITIKNNSNIISNVLVNHVINITATHEGNELKYHDTFDVDKQSQTLIDYAFKKNPGDRVEHLGYIITLIDSTGNESLCSVRTQRFFGPAGYSTWTSILDKQGPIKCSLAGETTTHPTVILG